MMTEEEIQAEARYVYHERIGICVGAGEPSDSVKELARREAEAAARYWREQAKEQANERQS